MIPVYAPEQIDKSIFLAGPTPRDMETQSWRPEALQLLEDMSFDGKVYVPEHRVRIPDYNYDEQVHWEWEALAASTVIVFWVPRELKKMPAMVTNVEFGFYIASGKVVFGAPNSAQKIGYLKALAARHNIPFHNSLVTTLQTAIAKTKNPYNRA